MKALWRADGAQELFNDAIAAVSIMKFSVVDMQWTIEDARCCVYTDNLFTTSSSSSSSNSD